MRDTRINANSNLTCVAGWIFKKIIFHLRKKKQKVKYQFQHTSMYVRIKVAMLHENKIDYVTEQCRDLKIFFLFHSSHS